MFRRKTTVPEAPHPYQHFSQADVVPPGVYCCVYSLDLSTPLATDFYVGIFSIVDGRAALVPAVRQARDQYQAKRSDTLILDRPLSEVSVEMLTRILPLLRGFPGLSYRGSLEFLCWENRQ